MRSTGPGEAEMEAIPKDVPPQVAGLLSWFQDNVERLEKAYADMGRQVERINRELDQRNAELSVALAEQSLMRNRLACLLESLHDGVVMVDVNERVVMFNARAGAILGLDPRRMIMRQLGEAFADSALLLPLRHCLEDGENPGHLELRWKRDGAEDVPLGVSTAQVCDASGAKLGAVATFSDLTAMKSMERELVQSRTLAALGEMAATVAHEIRNPLGGIGGFAGLLARDIPEDDPKHHLVELIRQGVSSLNRTVTNLLAYTKRLDLSPREIDLPGWLSELDEWLRMEAPELCGGAVEISCRHEGDPKVRFDSEKIRQVVVNLCRNALQAMPAGGRLEVASRREARELFLSVADSGGGISDENLARIFDPFFTTKENGTGLGLAIVRKIVEFHGGAITASSRPSEGTRFEIRIPQMDPWQES